MPKLFLWVADLLFDNSVLSLSGECSLGRLRSSKKGGGGGEAMEWLSPKDGGLLSKDWPKQRLLLFLAMFCCAKEEAHWTCINCAKHTHTVKRRKVIESLIRCVYLGPLLPPLHPSSLGQAIHFTSTGKHFTFYWPNVYARRPGVGVTEPTHEPSSWGHQSQHHHGLYLSTDNF